MKRKGKGSGLPISMALLWMPVLTFVMATIFAKMILQGMIPEERISVCCLGIAATVSAFSCAITKRRAVNRKILWCAGTAVAYGCMLMLGNLLFFGEAYRGIGGVWISVVLGMFVGILMPSKKMGKYA